MPNFSTSDLPWMRRVFKRHRGEAFAVAKRVGVSRSLVSRILSGERTGERNGKSLKAAEALKERALELLAEEEKAARANERRSRKRRNH